MGKKVALFTVGQRGKDRGWGEEVSYGGKKASPVHCGTERRGEGGGRQVDKEEKGSPVHCVTKSQRGGRGEAERQVDEEKESIPVHCETKSQGEGWGRRDKLTKKEKR